MMFAKLFLLKKTRGQALGEYVVPLTLMAATIIATVYTGFNQAFVTWVEQSANVDSVTNGNMNVISMGSYVETQAAALKPTPRY